MSTLLLSGGPKPDMLSINTPRAPTINSHAVHWTKPELLLQSKLSAEAFSVDIRHPAAFCIYWAARYQPLSPKTGPDLRTPGSVTNLLKDVGHASSLICGPTPWDYLTPSDELWDLSMKSNFHSYFKCMVSRTFWQSIPLQMYSIVPWVCKLSVLHPHLTGQAFH